MAKRFLLIGAAFFMMFFVACATVEVTVPQGFALVEGGERFFAVSPEGLPFRVVMEEHYPRQTVEFWSEALKRQFLDEGYHLRTEGEFFDCPAGRGFFIEWNVPYQGETFVYMTAVVPAEKVLYLAEAAAEHELYAARREALVESLKTITGK
ncbi:MAG: hypothetical protein JW760_04985 [Spirochaetales bacterium]|nr:hypothetical protein [Spirochaetales bacterium]